MTRDVYFAVAVGALCAVGDSLQGIVRRARPIYRARLELFVEHMLERLAGFAQAGDALDEILIIGHSTDGLTAVEVAARLLVRDSEIGMGAAAFLLATTLGSGLPPVALRP